MWTNSLFLERDGNQETHENCINTDFTKYVLEQSRMTDGQGSICSRGGKATTRSGEANNISGLILLLTQSIINDTPNERSNRY